MIDTRLLDTIVLDCLYKTDELEDGAPPADFIEVEGVVVRLGLHPKRLESHRAEVQAMLDQIGPEFHSSGGGGWSFLNLCNDKDGEQWGEHRSMEQLCMLAIGLKLGTWMSPRETWSSFPGGVPYFLITDGASA